MQKLKFLLAIFLTVTSAFSLAQERSTRSYKDYIKPTLKVLGAAGCFWLAYENAKIAGIAGQSYWHSYNAYEDLVKTGQDNTLFGGLAAYNHSNNMTVATGYLFSAPVACISTSILGAMLAKSAYDDVRKIRNLKPKC